MPGKIPQHWKILSGLLVGLVAGLLCRWTLADHAGLKWFAQNLAYPAGQLFLRLIFMAVVPLVVAALALGVSEVGDLKRFGRLGLKTALLTLLLSSIAVGIGLALVNTFKPGVNLPTESRDRLMASLAGTDAKKHVQNASQATSLVETFLDFFPKNPLADAVRALEGGLIPLMVFSMMVGLAMSGVGHEAALPLRRFLESLLTVMLKMIDFGMWLAPIGVAGLIFNTTLSLGMDAILILLKYVLIVLLGLSIHLICSYSLVLALIARRSPLEFFRQIQDVMLTAFSTSSSNATLPIALEASERNLGIPRPIGNFVLTIGATANQNGTALYEGITVLFLAQFFGLEITWTQQLAVMGMSILAGVGTAGVPGGSLPMIVVLLQSLGLPGEGIGIILGVDRLLDMCRTTLNVTGDLAIAACVAGDNASASKGMIDDDI